MSDNILVQQEQKQEQKQNPEKWTTRFKKYVSSNFESSMKIEESHNDNFKWESPTLFFNVFNDPENNVKLSEINFGENFVNNSDIKDASFKDLIPEIINDMKHIISQSKIEPTPDNWFTRKTGIAEAKGKGKIRYGFRERCAIPVFRSPSILESDSLKLGLGHTSDVDTDYTKLDRFEYLVKTNPRYVLKLLNDILIRHLKDKKIENETGLNNYLSTVTDVTFNSTIDRNDKINGVKWNEACKKQRGEGDSIASNNDRKTESSLNPPESITGEAKNQGQSSLQSHQGQGESSLGIIPIPNDNVSTGGGSIYKEYSKKIGSARSLKQIKIIGGELKKLMTKGGGKHDKQFTKLIKQLGGKRDELAKNK